MEIMNYTTEAENKEQIPILYSFRRCPYAMRARLAIASSKTTVVIREISLKNKPPELLAISEKATVPCLHTATNIFTDSLDIMMWVLKNNDPEFLLQMPEEGRTIIHYNDGIFKNTLDRTKYSANLRGVNIAEERKIASEFLAYLNNLLSKKFLFGDKKTLVDIAILPFIRQYAFIDKPWFNEQKWSNLMTWLDHFLASPSFKTIQTKYPIWAQDQKPIVFPT
jgi:glutathione S-transferase